MTFAETHYQIVRSIVTKDAVMLMQHQISIFARALHHRFNVKEHDYRWKDNKTHKSMGLYAPAITEGLLELLRPQVESVVERKLHSCYSYIRRYYKDSLLPYHVDRPSCEYSVTFALEADREPWAIWVEDKGKKVPVYLHPGDALIYRGPKVYHWRDPYEGNSHTQVFLHYVDADGPYAGYKYDKRELLGLQGVSEDKLK